MVHELGPLHHHEGVAHVRGRHIVVDVHRDQPVGQAGKETLNKVVLALSEEQAIYLGLGSGEPVTERLLGDIKPSS